MLFVIPVQKQRVNLWGGSGGVVNSLDFCPASLKSLGCFHFRCVLSSQWKSERVWQQARTCCLSCRMPQNAFFPQTCDLVSQKMTQRHFFPPSIPFPGYFLQLQQQWQMHCFSILGSTSIVIHSVKQHLLRNQPGSDSCDLL